MQKEDAKRVVIFVPGILQFPNNGRNWEGRATTWINTVGSAECGVRNGGLRADGLHYFCGPITRAFHQLRRIHRLANLLRSYAGWRISLVGHSNGCDIIVQALQVVRGYHLLQFEFVHLACGACEADFQKNGLNMALLSKRVGKVCVYVAGKDRALRLAHTLPGKLLGYGTLGLHGAMNVLDSVQERVGTMTWPEYGHSDCFHPSHFEVTMQHFTQ